MRAKLLFVCVTASVLLMGTNSLAVTWNGYGVHGGSISESAGQLTAVAGDTAGEIPDYHWNKSNWSTRTGEKAFYVTSDLNGLPVGMIATFSWDHVSGYWGNAYFNIMVEDSGGKRAIVCPALNSATSSGWDTDSSDDTQKPYCIFEAEAGWTGTANTGWYAADWDEVKGLVITEGPFTEFPDTLDGAATAQDDPVYSVDNWAAWADQAAGSDADWEKGGVMITFGQSTGPGANPDTTVIENLQFVTNSPTEVWVDDDFDTSTPGWGIARFDMIQDGIDAVAAGGTVHVAEGTYQESMGGWRDIEIFKSLSLIGAGSEETIVELTGLQHGVEIRGTNATVLLEGIRFARASGNPTSADWGIIVGETGGSFDSLTFRDVEVEWCTARNVHLANATYQDVVIEDCSFHHSGAWGLSVRGTINALTIVDSDFEYNGTSDPNHGIGFDIDMPTAQNISVSGGSFSNNASKGINMVKTANATFSGITANNNGGAPIGGWGASLWEWHSASSDISFQDSTFSGNSTDGILFGTEGATTIDNVTIQCCQLTDNGRDGVLLYHDFGGSANNVTIANSTITGNGSKGVAVSGMTNTVDATSNWWGTRDGSAIAAMVGAYVDYDPWLYGMPPCGDNILMLDVADASIYVKPSESVLIDMDALNLLQQVTGCQAVMNFSSTYFGTGSGDVIVTAGGGLWDELIYNVWDAGGDLDVAVGVDLQTSGGTDADATVAKITLTPTGTEGVTQVVFRPDVSEIDATFFSDTSHQPVWPTKINSQMIVIDGTDPLVEVTSPDGGEMLAGGSMHTITWNASDTNIDADSIQIEYYDGSSWNVIASNEDNDGSYEWTVPSLDIDTARVRVTVSDLAGNSASDTSDADFTIDSTVPAVDDITLMEEPGGTIDLTPSGTAVQGEYKVCAYVSDDDTGADSGIDWSVLPAIAVTDSAGNPLSVTQAVQADQANGRFTVVVEVKSTTANGTADISVTGVKDKAGNEAGAADDTFEIDKNQVTGTVSMATLASGTYAFDRDVVFKATDAGGVVLKTWTISVHLVNDPDPDGNPVTSDQKADGSYALTEVPATTANLSAKTDWSLRKRQAVTFDGDQQAVNDFTLPGGDLNDSNGVNILDYSILKDHWNSSDAVADINSDGGVGTLDYSLLKSNWFTAGDPE